MNPAQALTTFTTAYDRAAETRKFVREEAEKAQDNRLWVHVTGGKTKLKGVGTGSSQKLHTKTSSYGIVLGGQAAVNDSLTLGAAFSAGAGSTKNNSVSGKDKFDYYGLSVYGATSLGAVDLKADASIMLLKSDISIGGVADVKSDVKTYVYSLGIEAGRTFDLGAVDVTPFIGVDVYHVRGHGFNNGHGASVKKSDATAVEFPIGARIGKAFETQSGFSVAPAFSLAVVPTVADRKVDSKVQFAGAESTYRYTFTDDVKVRTSLGLDVKKGNFSAGLHAGYEWGNEERSSTSVQLRAKYMF
jgi:outer membrane autotransporter protein